MHKKKKHFIIKPIDSSLYTEFKIDSHIFKKYLQNNQKSIKLFMNIFNFDIKNVWK